MSHCELVTEYFYCSKESEQCLHLLTPPAVTCCAHTWAAVSVFYLLRWHRVNPSAIRLWLSDVKSLHRVSRCSRARAQHSPYLGWAARLRTRRSSILPRSDSAPEPQESPSSTELLSNSPAVTRAAISSCLQVSVLSQSESRIITWSEVTERLRFLASFIYLLIYLCMYCKSAASVRPRNALRMKTVYLQSLIFF